MFCDHLLCCHFPTPAAFLDVCAKRYVKQRVVADHGLFANSSAFLFFANQSTAAWNDVVAEYRHSTNPFPFAARRRHFVACALADDLAFELSKRKQKAKGQPAER